LLLIRVPIVVVFGCALLIWISGCKAEPVRADLDAAHAEGRIAGIIAAAEVGDPDHMPKLIDALKDDDPAVRLFAGEALRRRTGQTFGYRAYDPSKQRAKAIARWQAYHDSPADPKQDTSAVPLAQKLGAETDPVSTPE